MAGNLAGGQPNTSYPLSFFTGLGCSDDTSGSSLGTTTVSTDAGGNASFALLLANAASLPTKVSVTAVLPHYAPTSPVAAGVRRCVTGRREHDVDDRAPDRPERYRRRRGEQRRGEPPWRDALVQVPGHARRDGERRPSRTCPANYDLALYTDIGQAYNDITKAAGLQQISAELGAQFSPAGFTPAGSLPLGSHPRASLPLGLHPRASLPRASRPRALTPAGFYAAGFTPAGFTPAGFTPSFFTNPDGEIAYQSALYRSLFGLSYNDGTASEHIFSNVFSNFGLLLCERLGPQRHVPSGLELRREGA